MESCITVEHDRLTRGATAREGKPGVERMNNVTWCIFAIFFQGNAVQIAAPRVAQHEHRQPHRCQPIPANSVPGTARARVYTIIRICPRRDSPRDVDPRVTAVRADNLHVTVSEEGSQSGRLTDRAQ